MSLTQLQKIKYIVRGAINTIFITWEPFIYILQQYLSFYILTFLNCFFHYIISYLYFLSVLWHNCLWWPRCSMPSVEFREFNWNWNKLSRKFNFVYFENHFQSCLPRQAYGSSTWWLNAFGNETHPVVLVSLHNSSGISIAGRKGNVSLLNPVNSTIVCQQAQKYFKVSATTQVPTEIMMTPQPPPHSQLTYLHFDIEAGSDLAVTW